MVIPEWLWQITQWRRYKWAIVACQAVALGAAGYLLGIKHYVGNKPISTISERRIPDKASGRTGADQVGGTLTVEQARKFLRRSGWSFSSELIVDQVQSVSYDRWMGDLRLKCLVTHYVGDSAMTMVWCAISGKEGHTMPVARACAPLSVTMRTLIPDSGEAIDRAIATWRMEKVGLRRVQGYGLTITGWEITAVNYLEWPEFPIEKNFLVLSGVRK